MPSKPDPDAQRRKRRVALGDRVRELRTQQGWTQEELARQTGFDRKSVNRLETAAYSPTVDRIFVLADALGVPVATLLADIN